MLGGAANESHSMPEMTVKSSQHPVSIKAKPPANAYMTAYRKTQLVKSSTSGLKFGQYRLLQTLGTGEFGKVKLALEPNMQPVAIKFVKKSMLAKEQRLDKLVREIKLLEACRHKHVVQLLEVMESEKYIGMVMEYVQGGELFDYILQRKVLKDVEARRLFVQLISAVTHMHQLGIVHRYFHRL